MGVLSDGTPYLNQRGLAALCGVQNTHIGQISSQWADMDEKPRVAAIKTILAKAGVTASSAHIEGQPSRATPSPQNKKALFAPGKPQFATGQRQSPWPSSSKTIIKIPFDQLPEPAGPGAAVRQCGSAPVRQKLAHSRHKAYSAVRKAANRPASTSM